MSGIPILPKSKIEANVRACLGQGPYVLDKAELAAYFNQQLDEGEEGLEPPTWTMVLGMLILFGSVVLACILKAG